MVPIFFFIKNQRSVCGREDGIIAGFSSPHLERDRITFPRLLNIQSPKQGDIDLQM